MSALLSWLVPLLITVLRAVLPAVIDQSRPTYEDAARQDELRDKLRGKVKQHWGGVALLLCVVLVAGCTPKTIYVPDGQPVRLRETVRAKVWILDAQGRPTAAVMDLPEGWYCLPVPD